MTKEKSNDPAEKTGYTVDIDRPLSMETMANDVAEAVRQLGIEGTDVLGYSTGAGLALRLAIKEQDLVRKLPWHDEYLTIAPRPDDFANFFTKKAEKDKNTKESCYCRR